MQIEELEKMFPGHILPLEYPKPYPHEVTDPQMIKAIVLGCDPSNISRKDKTTNELETVFGLAGKGKDERYFREILINLQQLKLKLENIYVQNLCRNYFTTVTQENPVWQEAARLWRISLKNELNSLGLSVKVPVFLTARHLYEALLHEDVKQHASKDLYLNPLLIPISPDQNYLERPLIPLFRGGIGYYSLVNQWEPFKQRVLQILST